jgi:hypothetical protein
MTAGVICHHLKVTEILSVSHCTLNFTYMCVHVYTNTHTCIHTRARTHTQNVNSRNGKISEILDLEIWKHNQVHFSD